MSRSKYVMIGTEAHQKHTWFTDRDEDRRPIWLVECACGRMPVQSSTSAPELGTLWRKHVEDVASASPFAPRESRYGRAPESKVLTAAECDGCSRRFMRPAPYPRYRGPMGRCPECGSMIHRVED